MVVVFRIDIFVITGKVCIIAIIVVSLVDITVIINIIIAVADVNKLVAVAIMRIAISLP